MIEGIRVFLSNSDKIEVIHELTFCFPSSCPMGPFETNRDKLFVKDMHNMNAGNRAAVLLQLWDRHSSTTVLFGLRGLIVCGAAQPFLLRF